MSDNRYIDDVLNGVALLSDIADYVGAWHRGDGSGELHDYLGLTWDEYRLWVEKPEALRLIVAARDRGEPVTDLLEHADEHALAARNLDPQDARLVRDWLIRTGRLPQS